MADDILAMNAALAAITEYSLGTPERASIQCARCHHERQDGDFGLPADELKRIGEKLAPNHSAVIAISRMSGSKNLRDIAKRYSGRVINQQLMSSDDVAKAAGGAAS